MRILCRMVDPRFTKDEHVRVCGDSHKDTVCCDNYTDWVRTPVRALTDT